MFPIELEQEAFRASNGEFVWTRAQIPQVVAILRSRGMGILGGELWWIYDATGSCHMSVPQREGPAGIYTWATERRLGEAWHHFVERAAADALAAVERWPEPGELPIGLPARILYNLTWVSEADFPR